MDKYIELIGEDGKEMFELLLRFRFKGKDYIALRPEKEDEETAAVFEVHKSNGGEERYVSISDARAAKEVFVHFVSIWELAQGEEDMDEGGDDE
jgi:hypothetical protein